MISMSRIAMCLALATGLVCAQGGAVELRPVKPGKTPSAEEAIIIVNGKQIELDGLKGLKGLKGLEGKLKELIEGGESGLHIVELQKELEGKVLKELSRSGIEGLPGSMDDLEALIKRLQGSKAGKATTNEEVEVVVDGKRIRLPVPGRGRIVRLRECDEDHDSSSSSSSSSHRVVVKNGKVIVDERKGDAPSKDTIKRLEKLLKDLDIDVDIHAGEGAEGDDGTKVLRRILIKDGKIIEESGEGTTRRRSVLLEPKPAKDTERADKEAEAIRRLDGLRKRLAELRRELKHLEGGL